VLGTTAASIVPPLSLLTGDPAQAQAVDLLRAEAVRAVVAA